jgi:hypothetical protein
MRSMNRVVFIAGFAFLFWMQAPAQTSPDSAHRPVIYVMPNAVSSPGSAADSQVVVDSSHNGKEPQVAKIYQELQHQKDCQGLSENMIKAKADYFLLLQHGGGKGNRWALSDKNGDVLASGDSFTLGNSVKAACQAVAKDWQQHAGASGNAQ